MFITYAILLSILNIGIIQILSVSSGCCQQASSLSPGQGGGSIRGHDAATGDGQGKEAAGDEADQSEINIQLFCVYKLLMSGRKDQTNGFGAEEEEGDGKFF